MTTAMAFLHAHPLIWLLVGIFVVVTVLRILARIACLGVLIVVGIAVVGFIEGVLRGYV